MLERFQARSELHEQLSFWIGHNFFALPTLQDQMVYGEHVITAIDHELEIRK